MQDKSQQPGSDPIRMAILTIVLIVGIALAILFKLWAATEATW
jgi:hypothetical protein